MAWDQGDWDHGEWGGFFDPRAPKGDNKKGKKKGDDERNVPVIHRVFYHDFDDIFDKKDELASEVKPLPPKQSSQQAGTDSAKRGRSSKFKQ